MSQPVTPKNPQDTYPAMGKQPIMSLYRGGPFQPISLLSAYIFVYFVSALFILISDGLLNIDISLNIFYAYRHENYRRY